jgi:hypothetical protein
MRRFVFDRSKEGGVVVVNSIDTELVGPGSVGTRMGFF